MDNGKSLDELDTMRLTRERYGYRLNLTKPRVRAAYDEYKRRHGIPSWCPLSDEQRKEFEEQAIEQARQKQEQKE